MRTLVQEIRSLESEKEQIKSAFSLFLGIMDRRDAYLKNSEGIAKQGEKANPKPSIMLYGSLFFKMEQMCVAFPLQKSNWKVLFLF